MSVYHKENPSTIRSLFDSIAPRYDMGNSLLSFHMHALWNRRLVSELIRQGPPHNMLDLCAGTGEITWRAVDFLQKNELTLSHFHLVDFSAQMLSIAKARAATLSPQVQERLSFSQADATALPFTEKMFDTVAIAYGIRNIEQVDSCLKEVVRVLRPGGWLGIAELTRPEKEPLKSLHSLYLKTVVPLVGRLAIRNVDAYRYLCKSVHSFICPRELVHLLTSAGFGSVRTVSLMGGIATLFFAQKGL